MENNFVFNAIAYVSSDKCYKAEQPRQGSFSKDEAFIKFTNAEEYFPMTKDLEGVEYIWLIFVFHLNINKNIKPLVNPPFAPESRKYGLFATRSPYRPNPIGMSAVKLLRVTKEGLYVANSDLLDGTPILDIKPYIKQADCFPNAKCQWRDALSLETFNVTASQLFSEQAKVIFTLSKLNLIEFANTQLKFEPLNKHKKRVKAVDKDNNLYTLGCRTWQLYFSLDKENKAILLKEIYSNYTLDELALDSFDKYNDKDFHRQFIEKYPNNIKQ
jgi:tRNA-Thr(GGU) m(6)t(6)A37 methyltransferase TsaA